MTKSMNLPEAICRLPNAFYSDLGAPGDSSWDSLAVPLAMAAREMHLTEEHVTDYLRKHPEVIEAWIHHSEDKRCAPSHYFRREGDEYVLGFMNSNFKLNKLFASCDPAVVCTKFIFAELGLDRHRTTART